MKDTGLRSPQWIEAKRASLRPSAFAEEIEAEFSGSLGPVFPNFIENAWPNGHLVSAGEARKEMAKGGYGFGAMDWGWSPDWGHMLWMWSTVSGGVIVLKEFRYQLMTPRQVVQRMKAMRGLPPMTELDWGCWEKPGPSGGENIAKQFESAGLRVRQADKRFEPSLIRINELMVMDGIEGFPRFAIVEGEAPVLVDEITSLEETDIRAGHGFAGHVPCNGVDALRYGVMSFRSGPVTEVRETAPVKKGPLTAWKSTIMRPNAEQVQRWG